MEDSILISVKKVLSVPEDYNAFDLDIMMHINTVFMTLQDLGVGPAAGFMIDNDSATWSEYLPNDIRVNAVKTYVCLSVRMYFDPPATTWAIGAMKEQIEELAWRINVRQEVTDYYHEVPGVDVSLPVSKRVVPESYDPFA